MIKYNTSHKLQAMALSNLHKVDILLGPTPGSVPVERQFTGSFVEGSEVHRSLHQIIGSRIRLSLGDVHVQVNSEWLDKRW